MQPQFIGAGHYSSLCRSRASSCAASGWRYNPAMPPSELVDPVGLKKVKHLDEIEHKSIEEGDYKPRLKEVQIKLLNLQFDLAQSKRNLIIIFEGPDAAGKGGAIKRVTE